MENILDEIQGSERNLVYAGFWRRFAAAVIDGLLMQVLNTIIQTGIGIKTAFSFQFEDPEEALAMLPMMFTGIGISIVLNWLYFAFMESSSNKGTLGKMAMGIQVISAESKEQVTFGQATGRHFGKILSSLILGIGYLMMLWDDKNQTLHDKLAGTLIVRK